MEHFKLMIKDFVFQQGQTLSGLKVQSMLKNPELRDTIPKLQSSGGIFIENATELTSELQNAVSTKLTSFLGDNVKFVFASSKLTVKGDFWIPCGKLSDENSADFG